MVRCLNLYWGSIDNLENAPWNLSKISGIFFNDNSVYHNYMPDSKMYIQRDTKTNRWSPLFGV